MGQGGRPGTNAPALVPGGAGASARADSGKQARTRAAAAELAAHRRRLLECAVDPELDPSAALLLRVEPNGHRAGLARIAAAALAVGVDSHHNPLKAAAGDSRPRGLQLSDSGPPAADGTQAPAAAGPATDLRPTDLDSSGTRNAGREGEGSMPTPIAGREGKGSTPSHQGGPIAVKGQEGRSGCAVVPEATAVVPKAPKTLTVTTASTAIHSSKDPAGSSRPPALTSDLRATASRDAIAWREGESDSHEGEGSTPSRPGRTDRMEGQQAKAAPASPRLRSLASFDFLGSEAFASHLSKSAAQDSRPPELAADPDLDPSAALLLRVSAAGSASDLRPNPSPSRIAGREGEGSTPSNPTRRGQGIRSRCGSGQWRRGQDQGGPIAVKAQQAQAAAASPRLRMPSGRLRSAPPDLPSPPLFFAAGAELAGGVDFLGSEAFASQLSKSPAADSRPPELAADPDLDPSAALLLRVGPATDPRLDPLPSRIGVGEGHNGKADTEGTAAERAVGVATSEHTSLKAPAPDSRPPVLGIAGREGEGVAQQPADFPALPLVGEGVGVGREDHNGKADTEGTAVDRAAVAISEHTSLKGPASDSRPPALTSDPRISSIGKAR